MFIRFDLSDPNIKNELLNSLTEGVLLRINEVAFPIDKDYKNKVVKGLSPDNFYSLTIRD